MELTTERLLIRETTYEETKHISVENGEDSVDKFLASLTDDDVAIIFQDKDAVSNLLTRFSNSIGDGSSEIYGAWDNEDAQGNRYTFISVSLSIKLCNLDFLKFGHK